MMSEDDVEPETPSKLQKAGNKNMQRRPDPVLAPAGEPRDDSGLRVGILVGLASIDLS